MSPKAGVFNPSTRDVIFLIFFRGMAGHGGEKNFRMWRSRAVKFPLLAEIRHDLNLWRKFAMAEKKPFAENCHGGKNRKRTKKQNSYVKIFCPFF